MNVLVAASVGGKLWEHADHLPTEMDGTFVKIVSRGTQGRNTRGIWLWVKTMAPFWGGCTTHFRTYFSGDWDVHYGLLTHGHMDADGE